MCTASERQTPNRLIKTIDKDVELIKEFLREKIGLDFATCTAPSDENLLSIDMADTGGNKNPRGRAPWEQMREAMSDYRDYSSLPTLRNSS